MPEILKDFYYGNIAPFEAPTPSNSPLRKLVSRLAEYEAALAGLPDEENRQLIKDYADVHEQISSITAEESFVQGFRLGVRLMAECLNREGEG